MWEILTPCPKCKGTTDVKENGKIICYSCGDPLKGEYKPMRLVNDGGNRQHEQKKHRIRIR